MTIEERCKADFTLITGKDYDDNNITHKAVVEDMTAFRTNQADNIGLNSITLNGISESYLSDYPQYILKQLTRLTCNVKFL